MNPGAIVGICIGGAFAALILFMILRTVFNVAKPKKDIVTTEVKFDKKEFAENLRGAVQIPTVTVIKEGQSYEPFLKYHEYLEKTFPNVFKYAEKTLINGYSLVLKIEGTDKDLLPGCFLSHQDVVPAPPEGWDTDPFGGEIKDGFLYGRGSLDMKWHMIAVLTALDDHLKTKGAPKRTIYCCFGHDEEITGKDGAKNIAKYLYDNGIRMEYVVDEGGSLIDGSLLGLNKMIAAIGVCEKGYADLVLTSVKDGGHASAPKKRSSVDAICQAVYDLSHLPMKTYICKPIKDMFRILAPHMKFLYRFIFTNADILAPVVKFALANLMPVTNSAVRTTFAFTQLQGADAPNVIPTTTKAVVNVRVNIGQTLDEVKKYIQKVVGKDITVEELNPGFDPTPVSDITSDAYKKLEESITDVFGDVVVSPYPFIAASDAKHYYNICNNVYRFGPIEMTTADQKLIHSDNERVNIEGATKGAQFFSVFMEKTCY